MKRSEIAGQEYSDSGHLATVLLCAGELFRRVALQAAKNPAKARQIAEAATVELCRQVSAHDRKQQGFHDRH